MITNSLIVGGDFGTPKTSSVITKLGMLLQSPIVNGGTITDIDNLVNNVSVQDLIIWAPKISNEVEKKLP
jgi:hypothetical protein